jgi:hypothetical protein
MIEESSEGVCPIHTIAKWRSSLISQSEELVGGGEDGSGVEGRGWSWLLSWERLMNHSASRDPRRDRDSWNADTQLVESESIRGNSFIWCGDTFCWGRNMVIEPTVLIVSDEEQSFIPLWSGSKSFVDLWTGRGECQRQIGRRDRPV